MLSLGFGLLAALAWAVHDLLVRRLAPGGPVVPLMVVVLAAGLVALGLPAALWGRWAGLTAAALVLSGAAGLAYAVAMAGLYRAMALAPVRIVAPVVGAYPMLSLALAAAQGAPAGPLHWAAVAAVVGGIAVVAQADAEPGGRQTRAAVLWAAVGAVGFALTFGLGQAAALRAGDPAAIWPVLWIARGTALAILLAPAALRRAPLRTGAGLRLPVLMGVLDALALGLVLASGALANPEHAAIGASLFGVLTILLAWQVLGERVSARQWAGVAVVFGGIAVLAALAT